MAQWKELWVTLPDSMCINVLYIERTLNATADIKIVNYSVPFHEYK